MCLITHTAYVPLVYVVHSLPIALSVNKTTQAILEEHVNLLWLDQAGYFSDTKRLMHQGLPCTVSECAVIS